jgi:predicted amidohydrolase YtcJ
LRMVEGARVANGWSMQEVHDMHMTGEHCNLIGKQPDVIEGLKKYGIILSCGPDIIKEAPDWVRDYGAQIEPFILPFRTWIESGVKLVGQHWGIRMINQPGTDNFKPPFFLIWQAVTRKYDGKVWQPDERIDRVHGLKMWTSWASEYVRKPEKLGTLAVGKFADLLVLDRDFFTVPEDDLLKIRPMMTMVGGKIVVLQEPLARDFGLQAVVHGNNYSFNFKDEDVAYIGKPQAEVVKQYKGKNSESSF